MVKNYNYRQGLGASDEDVKREFVSRENRPNSPFDYTEEYAHIMERKYKRIEEEKRKMKIAEHWQHGNDRIVKEPFTNGHVGYKDRSHLPMERIPEAILYEETGILLEPFEPWRCPSCGVLHMKAVPQYWDAIERRPVFGCSFCHQKHFYELINFKRL